MSISLVMLAKNEEKSIARALHSVFPFVDEMVVIDTGSTDRTMEIAHEAGAVVYEFPWGNDFSAARNFGIEKASHPLVFMMDADEYLVSGGGALIDLSQDAGGKLGWSVIINRLVMFPKTEHIVTSQSHQRRVFLKEIRYQGAVLEEPVLSDEDTGKAPMVIEQTDYDADGMRRRARNVEIAQHFLQSQQFVSPVDQVITDFFLAKEYAALERWTDSQQHFEKVLTTGRDFVLAPGSAIADELITKYLYVLSNTHQFSTAFSFITEYADRFTAVPGFFHSAVLVFMEWMIVDNAQFDILLPGTKMALERVISLSRDAIEQRIFLPGIVPEAYLFIAEEQLALIGRTVDEAG